MLPFRVGKALWSASSANHVQHARERLFQAYQRPRLSCLLSFAATVSTVAPARSRSNCLQKIFKTTAALKKKKCGSLKAWSFRCPSAAICPRPGMQVRKTTILSWAASTMHWLHRQCPGFPVFFRSRAEQRSTGSNPGRSLPKFSNAYLGIHWFTMCCCSHGCHSTKCLRRRQGQIDLLLNKQTSAYLPKLLWKARCQVWHRWSPKKKLEYGLCMASTCCSHTKVFASIHIRTFVPVLAVAKRTILRCHVFWSTHRRSPEHLFATNSYLLWSSIQHWPLCCSFFKSLAKVKDH